MSIGPTSVSAWAMAALIEARSVTSSATTMRIAAIGLDVRAQRHQPVGAAAGQHHGRTGLGQGLGELFAQTAGGTGDQGNAAGKVKAVSHVEVLLESR